MNILGTLTLDITFFLTLLAILLIIFMQKTAPQKHPGVILGLFSCAGVLLSSSLLMFSLIKGIFSVEYVYHSTESALPLIYKISAFWSGSAGSMLLWTLCSALLLIFIFFKRPLEAETKTVFGVVLVFTLIFLVMISFINNPFKMVTAQTDGFGLHPALQSIGMVFHPPIIILAFACFFVALGYSFHDLRETDHNNQIRIRRWTLGGWILLTVGIISGGLWAYTELGWGGYWAWDPIENSSLVNWLLATAFLHTLSDQAQSSGKKKKSFILIALTVFSTLIGTFIARSGILKSVHAYSSQSTLVFLGIALVLLALSTILLYLKYRQKILTTGNHEGEIAGEGKKSLKELFQPSKLLPAVLLLIAVLVFGGTIFPLCGGQTPLEFYDYTMGICGLILLLLIGICPCFFSGRKSNLIPGAAGGLILFLMMVIFTQYGFLTKLSLGICTMLIINLLIGIFFNPKNFFAGRSNFSLFLLHVAIILIALGITGSKGMIVESEKLFDQGAVLSLKEYTLTFQKLEIRDEPARTVAITTLKMEGPRGEKTLQPVLAYYYKREMNHARAVIEPGLWEDLYIIFEGLDQSNRAFFKVMILRWVSLVWLGSLLLVLGTLLRFGLNGKLLYQCQTKGTV